MSCSGTGGADGLSGVYKVYTVGFLHLRDGDWMRIVLDAPYDEDTYAVLSRLYGKQVMVSLAAHEDQRKGVRE